MEILVISGLSGAGKSCAASCLEDIGYYTVDNMPAAIIPKFAEFSAESDGRYDRVALVNDIRGGVDSFQEPKAPQAFSTMSIMACAPLPLELTMPFSRRRRASDHSGLNDRHQRQAAGTAC